jgi:hypothetical protein
MAYITDMLAPVARDAQCRMAMEKSSRALEDAVQRVIASARV